MPLKLNLGLSKKIGLPDYGSLGASCHVELELDSNLLQNDFDAFHRHVRNAYAACHQAVQDELVRQQPESVAPGNGHGRASDPNHQGGNGRAKGRKATASQIRAIHAMINRQGLDLLPTLRQRCGVDYAEDLSITEASQFIDALKAQPDGAGGRR